MQTRFASPDLQTIDSSSQTTLPGYEVFFTGLLDIVHAAPIDDNLGEQVKEYVRSWLLDNTLSRFNHYVDQTYQRTYIGRSPKEGWEALVMSWKQGNTTSIHAHPQFAGYNFADGVFRVEIFESQDNGRAKLVNSMEISEPDSFFSIGQPGTYNNHIHRITCLSKTGHSLHVYSDDALKGLTYIQTEE